MITVSSLSTLRRALGRLTTAGLRERLAELWSRAGIGLVVVLIGGVFAVLSPNFLSGGNLRNIGTQITINTILAAGMLFVILIGGIDLSVGATVALCAVIAADLLVAELPLAVAIGGALLVSVLIGVVVGTISGFVSERWRVPSFIVTLGMLSVARGAALEISGGRTIFGFPEPFRAFGSGALWGVPYIFLVALLIAVIGWFVLARTTFGRLLYAIGDNAEAVRLAGHRTSTYAVAAFAILGGAVGVAAIVYMSRLNISSPILGAGFELDAIAAVIIGGASLSGGRGTMFGTVLGAVLLGVLTNGLILVGVGDNIRLMITGAIIVGAVVLDSYRTGRPLVRRARRAVP